MEGVAAQVVCDCGIPCRLQISSTDRNPTRRFYACSKRTNQCNFFAWLENDMPYQMSVVRNLKLDLHVMTVELEEAKSLLAAKKDEFQGLKESHEMYIDENQGLKESIEMYRDENGILFEESGLLFMEIDILKGQIKDMEVKCADLERSTRNMKFGFCAACAVAGCSVGLHCMRKN
ncbi:uncharacterized protein LOC126654068 [Mercurialis annua]|uniref:uncharacterized protein LOC126654068 n=1 Tax=Mercurialis annua TaxID=3986 RepID=UPI0024ACF6C2|nr:uncharacterized protein LOC126654068 [Mercurialis annua]